MVDNKTNKTLKLRMVTGDDEMSRNIAKKNPYIVQQVKTASREKLILIMYDLGLRSCRGKDRERAAKVLVELIAALNFDYKDIAVPMFDLYRYALDQVQQDEFENAIPIFEGLREAWGSALIGSKSQMEVS